MCVGFWSLEHPKYSLIICTNRDEYLSRPTSHAHFHSFGDLPENTDGTEDLFVLSGRDLKAGGTWFGTNRAGRVALLTNIAEEATRSYTSSRGQLVSSFLLPGAPGADAFVRDLTHQPPSADYAGFNLVLFEPSPAEGEGRAAGTLAYDATFVTNSRGGGLITKRPLAHGERCVGGMSNGVDGVDGHTWPKVVQGCGALADVISRAPVAEEGECADADADAESEELLIEELFSLLEWRPSTSPSNRRQLRTAIEIEPLALTPSLDPNAKPRANAKPHHYYGTRLSTVVLVSRDGRVRFVERDIWELASKEDGEDSKITGKGDGDDDENSNKASGSSNSTVPEGEDGEDDEIAVRGDPRAQRDFSFNITA